MPETTSFDPTRVLDLARYPLAGDGPARRALLADKRRELGADQICLLPGFVRPAALAAMVAEVRGDTDRLMAVLVYETEPGVLGDPEVNRTIYGPRVAAAQ